jgi:hypothetical protein
VKVVNRAAALDAAAVAALVTAAMLKIDLIDERGK